MSHTILVLLSSGSYRLDSAGRWLHFRLDRPVSPSYWAVQLQHWRDERLARAVVTIEIPGDDTSVQPPGLISLLGQAQVAGFEIESVFLFDDGSPVPRHPGLPSPRPA